MQPLVIHPRPTLGFLDLDDADLEDIIADAISDSLDMDWTSRDGARAVVRALIELADLQGKA